MKIKLVNTTKTLLYRLNFSAQKNNLLHSNLIDDIYSNISNKKQNANEGFVRAAITILTK